MNVLSLLSAFMVYKHQNGLGGGRGMSQLTEGLKQLFNERKKFIVIGLTGRTGSGCTTSGKILASDFKSIPLSLDAYKDKPLPEQLRYKIVQNYLEKNWKPFTLVRIKDMLTTFLLEEPIDEFISFVSTHLNAPKSELESTFSNFMVGRFKQMHTARVRVKEMLQHQKDLALESDEVYDFYFKDLPIFTDNLKDFLDNITPNGFTSIFQQIGNNVRTSGLPYIKKFNPNNMFLLSQRTNVPIKILRKRSLKDGSRVLVAIDSIRNPYEASFFKERYASFYLLSITTTETDRIDRLHKNSNLSEAQISKLDSIEYPEKLSGYKKFTSLNIQQCIQRADIHIFNPNSSAKKTSELAWKLVKYVALINHPGIVNPSTEERLMQLAYNCKLSSGCISRQVGAVVTDSDFSVKAIGWNDVPRGQVPCVLRNADWLLKEENLAVFSDYEIRDNTFRSEFAKVFAGKGENENLDGCNLSYCFKDIKNFVEGEKNQVFTRALHAEENAFLQISKYGGVGLKGGYLFTTASPCELCSKKAYQIGIKKIFYIDPYPGIAATHILGAGSFRPELQLFEGAIGRAFHQIFDPIMPYKEVVDLLVNIDLPAKKKQLEKEIQDLKAIILEKEEIILSLNPEIYDFEV